MKSEFKIDLNIIKNGIVNNEFFGFFQMKIDINNDMIIGFEVLARWNCKWFGKILGPKFFINEVKELALLDKMFISIYKYGLDFHKKLSVIKKDFTFSYNLDISQIRNRELIKEIDWLAEEFKLDRSLIEIEITENEKDYYPIETKENMLYLIDKGFKISMDDFGTGYSSLERLCYYPFSTIKLDAVFIKNIENSTKQKNIVKNILNLADDLGIDVILEGVESKIQLDTVKLLGCKYVQGFYYSVPLSKNNTFKKIIKYQ